MPINVSNTTQFLAADLKDVQRLEAPVGKKRDTPADAVATAVTVSISTDAKMKILNDTLT